MRNKIALAVIGTVGGITCLIVSGDKNLNNKYTLAPNNISKVSLSFGAILLAGGTWLYCHQLEEEINEAVVKGGNQQQLRFHFEALKVENATHKMNLDAQISRAKADFLARQEIAVLREELGFDLSESAAHHLEEMQYESTDTKVADSTEESGSQEANVEANEGFHEEESGNARNDDCARLEALKARFLEKLQNPDKPPLFEKMERAEKLEILRLVLRENIGIESTIFLCWGLKPGGRNHDKYRDARAMLEEMIRELGIE